MHVLHPDDDLGMGFIMHHVAGETIPRRILRDGRFEFARREFASQCGRLLARIHNLSRTNLPALRTSSAMGEVDLLGAEHARRGAARPVFCAAFRWLARHAPPVSRLSLVHGDFRNGNLIIGQEGIRAVLDWELAHLGDPMEDLGWLCVNAWRFGQRDLPVGGLGTREDLFAAYERAGGASVDPERVHFWEVLGTLKWGVICEGMAHEFMNGDGSVERAAIGRRASEAEIDLLDLLCPRPRGSHAS